MRVLGLSGSPRRGGNSETLLDKALEGAAAGGASVEKVVLNELSYRPCQECGACDETGVCVIDDGMREVYEKCAASDALIIASPVFFGSLSAQTKAMIDRMQCRWVAKYRLKETSGAKKRKGAFLAAGAWKRRDFFENAKKVVEILFATLDIAYAGELFVPGMSDTEDIQKEAKALQEAFEIGRKLVS